MIIKLSQDNGMPCFDAELISAEPWGVAERIVYEYIYAPLGKWGAKYAVRESAVAKKTKDGFLINGTIGKRVLSQKEI